MTIYQTISSEFDNLGLIRVPNALERLCASVGCHIFNMNNLREKKFFYGGNLENFRTSLVFMAPSGYSKSQHFSYFLHPRTGILADSGIQVTVRGTFSPESWMGTISNGKESRGILSLYKQGIIGADEFMKLGTLMTGTGTNNDEVYLMKALDQDVVTKDLAYGSIEEGDIGFTLWAGMRPCNLALASGLARRFSFQIFFPTIEDSVKFRHASRSGKMNKRITTEARDRVRIAVEDAMLKANTVDEIDYKPVEDWIDKDNITIPHFEEILYKRLALGWSVANDTLPEIIMTPELKSLLNDELLSRDIIRDSPEHEAVRRILQTAGRVKSHNLMKFLEKNYQLTKVQVVALINELLRQEKIQMDGEWYQLPTWTIGEGDN